MLVLLVLSGCSLFPMDYMQSANYSERIKFLVLHYTAIDYEKSVRALVNEGGLSAHYLVPESGDPSYPHDELKVKQLVAETQRAWHAGNSYWQGREGINDQSIGIEIVNVPRCKSLVGSDPLCMYPDYDPKQIDLLVALIKDILARNPEIGPTQIIGHADIAPGRKPDPGPRFPWQYLYQQGIGAWYEDDTVTRYWQQFADKMPNISIVQAALRAYGYNVLETGIHDQQTRNTVKTLQSHFMPWQVNGEADKQTVAVIFALLDRYFPEKTARLLTRYAEQANKKSDKPKPSLGQLDKYFPEAEGERSSRQWVNDKTLFQAYAGHGEILLETSDAQFAEILINGEVINIEQPFKPHQLYRYDLKRRTKTGTNTIEVRKVIPEGSQIHVRIPYPKLQTHSNSHVDFSRVDQLINTEVEAGFPGAVLMVVKNGEVIKHSAYGYKRKFADGGETLDLPIPMEENTLFDLASNTKMFATNLALMNLVSEGKLDINRPIVDYLPEFKGAGRDVRLVRDLLTHTAGYQAQVRFHTPDNDISKGFFSHNEERTKQLLTTRVPFKNGRSQKHVYSDIDYMLLGVLIERLSGLPLDLYLENNIYLPLKLQNTLFNPLQKGRMKAEFAATEIHGTTRGGRISHQNIREYVLQGEVHDEKAFYSMEGVAGHAGLFSNGPDMAVLSQLLLNRGGYGDKQIFTPEVLDMFIKPEESNPTYGLGWRRAANGKQRWHFGAYASPQAYGHTGWTGTVTVIDPTHDLAIVLLTNARHSEIFEDQDGRLKFRGKTFETGNYGSIVTLIYEALLHTKP